MVDDEIDGNLGAPSDLKEIPLEFTRHAHKKPIEHFKEVVEWMVHNKLNPAFARNDEVYDNAVRKIDNEVSTYSGSKFMSSVWTTDFVQELKTRPDLSSVEIPAMLEDKCDACNRSGHPPKCRLVFSGRAYDRGTLENISDDSSDDNSSTTQDAQENLKTFHVGR